MARLRSSLRCQKRRLAALPEEAFVVAQEGGALHLALMLQDGVALGAELFGADGHGHLDVLDFPLRPCTAVHPDAAVLQPLGAGFLLQVDGGEDAVRADAVGAVRVGQVAGHEYLVRLHLAEQVADDFHVGLADGVLLDAARLIERQVEEVAVGQRDVVVRAGRRGSGSGSAGCCCTCRPCAPRRGG